MVPIPLLIARFRLPSLSLSQERSLAAHRPFLTVPWHLSVGLEEWYFLKQVWKNGIYLNYGQQMPEWNKK
uniref:Uncharacterized protein n=1 Tax=Aegilops tauschii subsp. strangulata TaxID=200361 RepID=A0A453HVP1_AEGTS